jgi:hypothetical protein
VGGTTQGREEFGLFECILIENDIISWGKEDELNYMIVNRLLLVFRVVHV